MYSVQNSSSYNVEDTVRPLTNPENHSDNRLNRNKINIKELAPAELEKLVYQCKEKPFRTKQIIKWLYQTGAKNFDDMTDLSKNFREQLKEHCNLPQLTLISQQNSKDGSRKFLFQTYDGKLCETVGMPSLQDPNKLSVCVSSQAGCAMGCSFCATGTLGLQRSLSAGEICDQVIAVRESFNQRVSNIVVMGQGEPFANYQQLLIALRYLNSKQGLGIGARHITVSTCGIIPKIKEFAQEPEQFTLAVSLHSAVQETRDKLMPGVKHFPLRQLHSVMDYYVERSGRRPSYEYALIAGVNDSKTELNALVQFTEGSLCHVNIIQLNQIDNSPFLPCTQKRAQEFVDKLAQHGVEASIRNSRGQDIDAACGQLAAHKNKA